MIGASKVALPGVLLLALAAGAAAPPKSPPTPFANRAADQLDYLYLASDRPVLIRLHLRAGDKPYPAVWEGFMDKLFAWADKDNNGELSATEVARVMPAQTLSFQIQGAIGAGGNQTVPFATVDTNKDGKVSKEEFREYYRKGGVGPLRFSTQNTGAQTAKQTNDAIYRRLGRSKSGKLTKEDLAKLEGLLAKLDENEDEYLAAAELNTEGEGQSIYGQAVAVAPGTRMATPQGEPTLSEIQPTHTAAALAQQVMRHYDKNRDGKLAAGKDGLTKSFVGSLDANKDGKVDAKEVEAFFRRGPDVVLRAKVGPVSSGVIGMIARTGLFGKPSRAEVLNQKTLPADLAKKVKKVDADNVSLELGDARFTIQASEGQSFNRLQGVRQFYLQQFDALADKDGFVERGKDNAGNQFISRLFSYADKNADGKLHRKEFVEWLDLIGSGGNAFVSLSVADNGRSLYNLLDVNGDARLAIREMRGGWSRVQPLCKDGKGLAQAELPRTLKVTMAQGFNTPNQPFFIFGQQQAAPKVPRAGPTPAWFLKMDRNGDGDVSPKEWLGSEEKFREIDADGDGLVSAAEARDFEKNRSSAKKDAPKEAKKPGTE